MLLFSFMTDLKRIRCRKRVVPKNAFLNLLLEELGVHSSVLRRWGADLPVLCSCLKYTATVEELHSSLWFYLDFFY